MLYSYNTRNFWKFLNEKRKVFNSPSVMKNQNTTSNTGQDSVDLFADYFETVYSKELNTNCVVGTVSPISDVSAHLL